ncbi:MAG: recombinase RecA [Pirellulaceae bacterium]|nr:recombinase RecA [Pirellulaceae bacterium]
MHRLLTGVPGLDDLLGGGLIPGTLTAVVGATGIGKTQLGVQFARAGSSPAPAQRPGVIFDMSSRGDSQSHAEYARRIFDWNLSVADGDKQVQLDSFFANEPGEYLHIFDYVGRRVTKRDLDWDDWHTWQAHLNARLRAAIAFLYGNFVRGCERVVIDGIEPTDRPGESIQFNLFEYLYHQILRKDPEWVARDLFREAYLRNAAEISTHAYDPARIGCLLLYTSHETMLDDLISRRLDEGDVLSNANTIIYMGKVRRDDRLTRALYIAKHRGSVCDERIVPYTIDNSGVRMQ